MRKLVIIFISILVCILLGDIGSSYQKEALQTWYPELVRSSLTPPGWVFAFVWTFLYIGMGVSFGLVLGAKHIKQRRVALLFLVQLMVNFSWSILFFYKQCPLCGLIDILVLDLLVVIYIIKSYAVNRYSSYLFIPYLLWLCLATYLNAFIVWYN
jgi:tryptophan-rich sensory protein